MHIRPKAQGATWTPQKQKLTEKFRNQSLALNHHTSPENPYVVLMRPSKEIKPSVASPTSITMTGSFNDTNLKNEPESPSNSSSSPLVSHLDTSFSLTKLHELCSQSSPSLEMIRIFISTHPYLLKQRNAEGDLPIHIISKSDNTLVFCEILRKSPEGAFVKDKNGDMPIHLVCRRPKVNVSILKALLQISPESAKVKQLGCMPLHTLCINDSATPEAIQLLIAAYPMAARCPNSYGNLPLHYACSSQKACIESLTALMDVFPLGMTYLNKSMETPISRAVAQSQGDEAGRARIRIMLRRIKESVLKDDQKEILRQLNWDARKLIVLVCRRHIGKHFHEHSRGLLDIYFCIDGVWREIVSYL